MPVTQIETQTAGPLRPEGGRRHRNPRSIVVLYMTDAMMWASGRLDKLPFMWRVPRIAVGCLQTFLVCGSRADAWLPMGTGRHTGGQGMDGTQYGWRKRGLRLALRTREINQKKGGGA